MKRKLLLVTATAACLIGPAAVADATADRAVRDLIERPAVCGSEQDPAAGASVAEMVMVEGFGKGGFRIDTTNPEAQAWFDHGVRLRWAFAGDEAVRAFQRARLIDPSCGMCAWGEAWAMGADINGGPDAEVQAEALVVARQARRLGRRATPLQRQMMDVLIQRYSGRESTRSQRFAAGMDRLARRHPDDLAVAVVAADAHLIKAERWWTDDGKPAEPGITRAMGLLETVLARDPDDTAAIHLYIHLTEWSGDPHRALPYGERLALLAPGASHLVHMPSHTYYRVGRYRDAMKANVDAVALDRRYDGLAKPPGGVPGMGLHGHNIHFGLGGALMAGGAADGLALADWFLATYPTIAPDNIWRQVVANNVYAVYGRFGTQDQVAALPEPPATHPLLRISWHYARGEAAARRGDAAGARAESVAIAKLRESLPSDVPGADMVMVFTELSQRVLEGRAAMIGGDYPAAVSAYGRAAELQNKADLGGDPPAWWFPIDRSLAAALLAGGDAAGAKAKIENLLKTWPADPYSWFVLAQAERALGNTAAAEAALARSRTEWIGGDMTLPLA